jgi:hypothetical protein
VSFRGPVHAPVRIDHAASSGGPPWRGGNAASASANKRVRLHDVGLGKALAFPRSNANAIREHATDQPCTDAPARMCRPGIPRDFIEHQGERGGDRAAVAVEIVR